MEEMMDYEAADEAAFEATVKTLRQVLTLDELRDFATELQKSSKYDEGTLGRLKVSHVYLVPVNGKPMLLTPEVVYEALPCCPGSDEYFVAPVVMARPLNEDEQQAWAAALPPCMQVVDAALGHAALCQQS